jgi:hypothetical protein
VNPFVLLSYIRSKGWSVAAHYDGLDDEGEYGTYWAFTVDGSFAVCGWGRTDADALAVVIHHGGNRGHYDSEFLLSMGEAERYDPESTRDGTGALADSFLAVAEVCIDAFKKGDGATYLAQALAAVVEARKLLRC